MNRPTVLREAVHLHLQGERYVTEMEIPGKQTYFHGSAELTNLAAVKSEKIGHCKCLFFTSHFGYALDNALPIGGTHSHYHSREKFYKEIVFDKPVRPLRKTGYIYPIMLQLKPKILELNNNQSDAINLAGVLWRAGLSKNIATDGDVLRLMNYMREHNWFTLDYKGGPEDMAFGLSRDKMIKLLHDDPSIIGFSCYERKNDPDDCDYPAIGIFHDKIITDWITQHKPLRVRYEGERFNPRKNADEYVVSVKNI